MSVRFTKQQYPLLAAPFVLAILIWLGGSTNPETPAGYVGYMTQGAIFGKSHFYGLQTGPNSPGRTWRLNVVNVSITPYTYTEDFNGASSVLSQDNLKISFQVHIVFNIKAEGVKDFVEKYATVYENEHPDKLVKDAYDNFLSQRLRTFARDEIQKFSGLDVKDKIPEIGSSLSSEIQEVVKNTPFNVQSVVVGNIQYPEEVANAVSAKMAATQVLERKQTEIDIEEKEKQKRIIDAEGIAKSMEIINQRLSPSYLQHEAIEAQKDMINSPNHTVIYIPTGPMGVPLVGALNQPPGWNEPASPSPPAPTK
jgi:regulator of protease activity HflC (stomatin/prohibitin superfamily)